MSLLNKEVISNNSPIIAGFFHFLLAIVIGYTLMIPIFSIPGFIFTYSANDFVLGLIFFSVACVASSLSTLLQRKGVAMTNKPTQVLVWGLFYLVVASLFMFDLSDFRQELVGVAIFFTILVFAYVGATSLTLRLSRNLK
jgi:hypothetical protein